MKKRGSKVSESCPPYPKIDTLFDRGSDFRVDEARVRRPEFLVPREWAVTEKIDGTNVRVSLERNLDEESGKMASQFGLPNEWVEENMDAWVARFYGRTENSQMPTFLLDHLQRTFTLEKMQSLWRCKGSCTLCSGNGRLPIVSIKNDIEVTGEGSCPNFEPYPIVLYGEGYGARIQKGGGDYRADASFRLFDVLIGGTWLRYADVENVALQLGIEPVPLLGIYAMDEVVELVRHDFASAVSFEESVKSGGHARYAEGVVAFTDPPLFNSHGQRLMFKLKTKDFVAGKR